MLLCDGVPWPCTFRAGDSVCACIAPLEFLPVACQTPGPLRGGCTASIDTASSPRWREHTRKARPMDAAGRHSVRPLSHGSHP